MGFDYALMNSETVQPLIDEFGKSGSLVVNNPTTGNPYDSQLGGETEHAVRLVQTVFKMADNSGTLVEVGDVLFIVSTKGVTIDPNMANRIKVNNMTYQVVRIDPLKPGDVVLLWKIHGRK